MLSVDEKKAIINYRIQKSYGNLNEAKEVAKLGFWNLVGNRFYYLAFHMASALLLDKGLASCFHSGMIHLIGTQFVVKGLLDKSYGRLLSRLFELRQLAIMMICMMQQRMRSYLILTRHFNLFKIWKS